MGSDFVETASVLIGERRDKGLFFRLIRNEKRVDKHRLGCTGQLASESKEMIDTNLCQLPFRLP